MSSENKPPYDTNPFASPAATGQRIDRDIPSGGVALLVLKKFREQIHALGALWIIMGGILFWIVLSSMPVVGELEFFAFSGLALTWLAIGLFSCFKQMWAVYVGLGLSYLSLISVVLNFNLCALVILAVVLFQGHRVIGFAKQLKKLGIPLTATSKWFVNKS